MSGTPTASAGSSGIKYIAVSREPDSVDLAMSVDPIKGYDDDAELGLLAAEEGEANGEPRSPTRASLVRPQGRGRRAYRQIYGEGHAWLDIMCIDNLEYLIRFISQRTTETMDGFDHEEEHTELSPQKKVLRQQPSTHLERRQAEQRRTAATSLRGSADDRNGAFRDLKEDEELARILSDEPTPPPSSNELRNRTNMRIARWVAHVALALEGAAEANPDDSDSAEEEEAIESIHGAEGSKAKDGDVTGASTPDAERAHKHHDGKGKPGFFSKAVGSQVSKKLRGKDDVENSGFAPIDDDKGLLDLERKLMKSKKREEKMKKREEKSKKGNPPEAPADAAVWGTEAKEVHGKSVYHHLKNLVDDNASLEQAARLFDICDVDGDGKVGRDELLEALRQNPAMATELGIQISWDNPNGGFENFDAFWNIFYHGYKAKEGQEGGLSRTDFESIVKKHRLTRAAALQLFRSIDVDESGFVEPEEVLKSIKANPTLFSELFFDPPPDLSIMDTKKGKKIATRSKKGQAELEEKQQEESFWQWWREADADGSGMLDLEEFTRAYQMRDLKAFRWKPSNTKGVKVSFKMKSPKPDVEAAFRAENGFGDFDYAFVLVWPTTTETAKECESILLRLKQGGLDYFAFRSSSYGITSHRDAKLVIKVRASLKRLRAHAAETGYKLLVDRARLIEMSSDFTLSKDGTIDAEGKPHLFINHDPSRVQLHPYDFIYAPFVDEPWFEFGGKSETNRRLFHCTGGLPHPFSSRHRIEIIHEILTDPNNYGGCGIDLHLLKAPFCTHFPIHRDNMVTQMDANFHPTFTARLAKFVKQQEAIDERDAAVAEQTRTEFDSSTCGAALSIGKLILRWLGGWLWSEFSVLWYVPVQNLRDYFGEKTALYFAFLGEYMRWQFVLAIVGSITGAYNMYRQSNEESPLAPWFALFVGAWAETHARHWRTYEFAFALRYGINERDEAFLNMRDRPYFHGKITRSVIDGSEITHYPWERRAARYGMSILCISIAALSGCILVTLILYLRVFMMKRRGATHEWAETVSSGVLGVYITVSNTAFRKMALALTDWENHRTDVEYENALVFKLFSVQFLNSYATLYYVAFFKGFFEGCLNNRCVEDLYFRLIGVLGSRVAYKAFSLAVVPRVKVIMRLARALMRKKNVDETNDNSDRVADHQRFLNPYNSVIASTVAYDELVIDLGYMILFAGAAPAVPLLMIPLTLIRKWSDGTRLLFDFQRPVPRTAGTIGMWNGVLRVLARLAMVTNGLVVLVTMHGMEAHNRRSDNMVAAEVVWCIALVVLFITRNPTEAYAIKVQRLRQAHIVGRLNAMAAWFSGDDDDSQTNAPKPTPSSEVKMVTAESSQSGNKRRTIVGSAFHHYSV